MDKWTQINAELSDARFYIDELKAQLAAVTAKYDALYAQLNTESDVQYAQRCTIEALTAERDELRKALHGRTEQLNAVPVDAIGRMVKEVGLLPSNTTMRLSHEDYSACKRWLETQVTP